MTLKKYVIIFVGLGRRFWLIAVRRALTRFQHRFQHYFFAIKLLSRDIVAHTKIGAFINSRINETRKKLVQSKMICNNNRGSFWLFIFGLTLLKLTKDDVSQTSICGFYALLNVLLK